MARTDTSTEAQFEDEPTRVMAIDRAPPTPARVASGTQPPQIPAPERPTVPALPAHVVASLLRGSASSVVRWEDGSIDVDVLTPVPTSPARRKRRALTPVFLVVACVLLSLIAGYLLGSR